jgi:hypothetical protein
MKKIVFGKEELEISSETSKGFAMAALVVAIVAVIMPIISLHFVWIALILTAIAIFTEDHKDKGGEAFSKAAFIICIVNVLLLSPVTWREFHIERVHHSHYLEMVTVVLFVIPVIIYSIQNPSKENEPKGSHSL